MQNFIPTILPFPHLSIRLILFQNIMEGDNNTIMEMIGSSGGPAGSRWTPIKEQVDLLENLYRQGVRTPSAQQIQHITSKLRVFGYIEGKNVFYWFQNHKARQRQKLKEENVALLNRFMLHKTHPPPQFANYYPNAFYHPSLFIPPPPPPPPPNELGFRPNYRKLFIPGCYNKIPLLPAENINNTLHTNSRNNGLVREPIFYQEQNYLPLHNNNANEKGFFINSNDEDHFNQETLDLFPLHPNGNLRENRGGSISISSDTNYNNNRSGFDQRFDDFFCMAGQCKRS